MATITMDADELVKLIQGVVVAQAGVNIMLLTKLIDAGVTDSTDVIARLEAMAETQGVAGTIITTLAEGLRRRGLHPSPPEPALVVIDGGKGE